MGPPHGNQEPRARAQWPFWLVVAVAAAGTVVGWLLLWHIADDAYITYRYLSNAMLGRGLVWNPEPFAPVDGNSDFLWSLLLLGVWRVLGIEPPDVSTWLALGFGLASLLLVARALWRLELPERLARRRVLLLSLALAVVVTNRAWLAMLSCGLGVSFFNLLLLAWCLLAASPRTVEAPRRWLLLGALAAACGVARPEGHLAVAATALLGCWWGLVQRRSGAGAATAVLAIVPPFLHLLWRKTTTGDWMLCTYRAKAVGAWPEAGLRYLASFVVEFGLWAWAVPVAWWLLRRARAPGPLALLRPEHLGAAAVAGVLGVHFVYYTFVMGGDLFEWRVYSHLVPLLPLWFVLAARGLGWTPRATLLLLAAYVVAALPVGWLKYSADDGPVAPHAPALLRPLLRPYDAWQQWLGDRLICKRNHEMKVNLAAFVRNAGSREQGARIPWDGFPVHAAEAAGYVAWALPNVAILDCHGLNDAVIARNPVRSGAELLAERVARFEAEFALADQVRDGFVTADELRPWLQALQPEAAARPGGLERLVRATIDGVDRDGDGRVTRDEYLASKRLHGDRLMAHERTPPPGYLEGFRPNVHMHGGVVDVVPRDPPLTADDIRRHEAQWRERMAVPR